LETAPNLWNKYYIKNIPVVDYIIRLNEQIPRRFYTLEQNQRLHTGTRQGVIVQPDNNTSI